MVKRYILVFLLGMFMLSLASAAEFDNIKNTLNSVGDDNYPDIEIKNMWDWPEWLGGKTLFNGTMTDHREVCDGEDCYSIFKVYTSGDSAMIQDVRFKTQQEDGSWINQDVRNFQFYYWTDDEKDLGNNYETQCIDLEEVCEWSEINQTNSCYTPQSCSRVQKPTEIAVPEYITECTEEAEVCTWIEGNATNGTAGYESCYTPQTCEQVLDGYSNEPNYQWSRYDLGKVPTAGHYWVKLEAKKKPSRTVDWQIKTNGKWLEEWAIWEGSSGGTLSPTLADAIAYYPMNETTGTVRDVSMTGHDGLVGNAFDFDGVKDRINTPIAMIPDASDDFSVCTWIYPETDTDAGYIYHSTGITNYYSYLQIRADNTLWFRIRTGVTNTEIISTATVTDNAWNHICTIKDGTGSNKLLLYIDGINVQNTTDSAGTNMDVIDEWGIGAGYSGSGEFNGSIDEFSTWTRALTPSEITSLHNSGNGKAYADLTAGEKTNLVSYYSLDEAGSDPLDSHGSNDGTLSGGTNNGATRGATGIIENASSLDGTNDYIEISDSSGIRLLTGGTISTWLYSDGDRGFIAGKSDGAQGTGGYIIELGGLGAGGKHGLDIALGAGWDLQISDVIPTGSWQMVTVTWDGSDIYAYLNASEIGHAVSSALPDDDAANSLFIGKRYANDQFYGGDFDEYGIWDRALNSTEISELYNNGTGLVYSGSGFDASVTLNSPADESISTSPSVTFNATADTGSSGAYLTNMSLWTNATGTWALNESITGLGGASAFNFTDGSLVAYYPLNETTGTVRDVSMTGHDGVVNNAFKFDGAKDYFQSPAYNLGTGDYTVSGWYYINEIGTSEEHYLWTFGYNDANSAILFISTTDKYSFLSYKSGSGTSQISTVTPTVGWNYLTLTRSGTSIEFFVNGTSVWNNTYANHDLSLNDPFEVGWATQRASNAYFNGSVDEIGYWSKKLSNAEIQSLYNSGAGKSYADLTAGEKTNLVSYYSLDEVGSDPLDSHGSNDGTLSGGTISGSPSRGQTGIVGQSFDSPSGGSDYISSGYTPNINPSNTEQSMVVWTKPDSAGSGVTQAVWGTLVGSDQRYYLAAHASGKWRVYFGTTLAYLQSTSNINYDEWTHVGVIIDGTGNAELFINGTSEDNLTVSSYTTSGELILLNIGGGVSVYDGGLDEVGIWDKALTSTEISKLYNSGSGLAYSADVQTTSSTQTWTKTISDTTIWNVEACDTDGDCGFATSNYTVYLDATAPQFNLVNVTTPIIYNYGDNITIDVNITDANLEDCWYNYNTTNTSFSCTSGVNQSLNVTSVQGYTDITFYANDSVGNINSSIASFIFDNIAPNITQSSMSYTYMDVLDREINVSGITVTDANIDSCWYDMNGTNYTANCTGWTIVNETQVAKPWFMFYANDTLSNENSLNVTFDINNTVVTLRVIDYNDDLLSSVAWSGDLTYQGNPYTVLMNDIINDASPEITYDLTITDSNGYNQDLDTNVTINASAHTYNITMIANQLTLNFVNETGSAVSTKFEVFDKEKLIANQTTSQISVQQELAQGLVLVRFNEDDYGENWTQFYEYDNTWEEHITENLTVLTTTDWTVYFVVKSLDNGLIGDAVLRAETASLDAAGEENVQLIGQRVTGNDGTTFIRFDSSSYATITVTAEGYSVAEIPVTTGDEFATSKSSPYVIYLEKSSAGVTPTVLVAYPTISENVTTSITGAILAKGRDIIKINTDYREELGLYPRELTCDDSGLCDATLYLGTDYGTTTETIVVRTYIDNNAPINRTLSRKYYEEVNLPTNSDNMKLIGGGIALLVASAAIGGLFNSVTAGFSTFMGGAILLGLIDTRFLWLTLISLIYFALRTVRRVFIE